MMAGFPKEGLELRVAGGDGVGGSTILPALRYTDTREEVVTEVALTNQEDTGSVIITAKGRASQPLTKEWPDALHDRTYHF